MIFGREHELAALHAAYTDMLAGHGSMLFLTGEAGLGKTTLVHTWAATRDTQETSQRQSISADTQQSPLAGAASTLFLESACSIPIGNVDVGRLEALQPWADVVAQLHEKLSTQSTSKSTSQHKLNLGKLMRDSAPAWLWALPFVGEVAHAALVTARLAKDQRTGTKSQVHSPTGPDPSVDERQYAAANQEQVFQQYVNLLTKIASETPIVIFLDDLHWADTSSCNLLFYLARQIAGKKILVIATYRQDDAARGSDGKGHAILTVKNEILRYSTGKELALSYLSRDAIRAFLEGTFAGYVADEKFEHWLHKISDGNSLFMTQFVKTLREDGHLNDTGRFVGDYATVIIPKSALAVVEERTRRLDAGTRKLLMYATAEGEEFTTYVLERLTEKKSMQLLEELHTAAAMGLIMQRGTARLYANMTTGIFGFSHALFHKALYNSLFDLEKLHLHQQCFQLLKTEWDRLTDTKDRTTTLATKLLAHAEKCEEWTTVAEVALAAAQEFWKTFNVDEALAMIRRVLKASDAAGEAITDRAADRITSQRAEALFLKGRIGGLRGRHNEAAADFRAAEGLFASAGIVDRAVDAVNGLVWTHNQTAAYDMAFAEAERALMEARAVGHLRGEAIALGNIGIVHMHGGAYDEALSDFERSLAIFTATGDRQGEANSLGNIGVVHMHLGAYDEALSDYERSLAIFTVTGDRQGEANVLGNIGIVHSNRGANDDGLSFFERGLAIYTAIGNRAGEAHVLGTIGIVHSDRGAYDEALSYYERNLAINTAIGDHRGEAITLCNIGNVQAFRGAYDEALSYYKRSLAIHTAIGNRRGEAITLGNIGYVHNDRGAYDEALSYYERSLATAAAISYREGEASALNGIGWTHRLSGKISEARSYLERSLALATTISALKLAAQTTAELGLVTEAESENLLDAERDVKRAESRQLIEDALVMFRELKLDKETAKWEKELERLKASA